jgi:hypothetical protein
MSDAKWGAPTHYSRRKADERFVRGVAKLAPDPVGFKKGLFVSGNGFS